MFMYAKIMNDIKSAMKEKDTVKRDVLKQVIAKTQADAKENKKEIDDETVKAGIRLEIKQQNQTLKSIKGHEDAPLYKETVAKISILREYLPDYLTGDDLKERIAERISAMSEDELKQPEGKIKGGIIKDFKTVADSSEIGEYVVELLKEMKE